MSIILFDKAKISNLQSNNSSAKMMYSFNRERRFKDLIKKENGSIGQQSSISKIGFSFSKSKKEPKIQKLILPSPQEYEYASKISSFKRSENSSYAFTFGASRKAFEKLYGDTRPPINTTSPGPGNYEINTFLGEGSKFSMRNKNYLNSLSLSPGPQTYENISSILPGGKSQFSKYKDCPRTVINPKLERFKSSLKNLPGPGDYDHLPTIKNEGRYPISTIDSSNCFKFTKEKKGRSFNKWYINKGKD